MANFQVPQFISQKPKIVGFLTLPQFFYLAGAALIGYISFYVFTFFLAILITLVAAILGIAFAFIKINGQEFPKLITAVFGFMWGPKVYTWQRQNPQTSVNIDNVENIRNKMSLQEKLKSITLSIATGKFFKQQTENDGKEKYETVVFLTGERGRAKKVDY
ncbi:PrgI family protein [bacterium]|nr:MAG: PrgI family protein [bacterium]